MEQNIGDAALLINVVATVIVISKADDIVEDANNHSQRP